MVTPEFRITPHRSGTSSGFLSVESNDSFYGQRAFFFELFERGLWNLVSADVSDAVLDLYDIFNFLRFVDRSSPLSWSRKGRSLDENGHRLFRVSFPVRDVAFWNTGRAASLLQEIVEYLSGDVLDASFSPMTERTDKVRSQLRLPIDIDPELKSVVLFSGGLDSLFAAIKCLGEDRSLRTLAVSVNTNHRHVGLQRRLVHVMSVPELYGHWTNPLVHLPLSSTFWVPREWRNSTCRMRVLGFFAAGVLAAVGVGLNRLVVAENGPGAINLPSNAIFGGAQLNRAMHPKTLRLVSELASLALERSFNIENVGVGLTKRQMIADLNNAGFRKFIDFTNSCDRFPYSDANVHCGKCSSCLLRALGVLDLSRSFERIGKRDSLPISRMATMYGSSSMKYYLALGQTIDHVLASGRPMDQLWALDPAISDVTRAVSSQNLLKMLADFRQDIADLDASLTERLFVHEHLDQFITSESRRTSR